MNMMSTMMASLQMKYLGKTIFKPNGKYIKTYKTLSSQSSRQKNKIVSITKIVSLFQFFYFKIKNEKKLARQIENT